MHETFIPDPAPGGLRDRPCARGRPSCAGWEPRPPLNATKAAPSYLAVGKAIAEATRGWDQPGATAPPAAAGWRAFFEALNGELAAYAAAGDDKARLTSLGRIHQMDLALHGVAWAPVAPVRAALDEWLAPRIRIAWAERRLIDFVKGQSGASENHERWVKFVGDDLASALASYEGAKTVQARQAALKRLTGVLAALRSNNRTVRWPYSAELQAALDSLYNLPNLDVSADVASVTPFLSHDVVVSGPIERNGYVSQVTAGPKTGFGLLASDDGLAFYNKQIAYTYTPITDFQRQLEQDKRGRKVAKLYEFSAASSDAPELTITAVLRPSTGLSLAADYAHNIGAGFASAPTPGHGLARGVLAVIGLNRDKLTQKVGDQARPKIAEGVVTGAQEEAAERDAGRAGAGERQAPQGPRRQRHGRHQGLSDHRPEPPLAADQRPGRRHDRPRRRARRHRRRCPPAAEPGRPQRRRLGRPPRRLGALQCRRRLPRQRRGQGGRQRDDRHQGDRPQRPAQGRRDRRQERRLPDLPQADRRGPGRPTTRRSRPSGSRSRPSRPSSPPTSAGSS